MKTNKQQVTDSWKLKIAKGIVKCCPPVITALWHLMILAAQGMCWIFMPIITLCFAQWFTAGMDTSTDFGVGAIATAYIVAIVAGIRGAIHASREIADYKNVNLIGKVKI